MSNQHPNIGDSTPKNQSASQTPVNPPKMNWLNVVSMHEHVGDLLGAYAIHSVNDAESELVELHLEHCVLCQAELTQHFETAARLGAASVLPVAPRVWDNVLNEIRLTKAINSSFDPSTVNTVNTLSTVSYNANHWGLAPTPDAQPHEPSNEQPSHQAPGDSTIQANNQANNQAHDQANNQAKFNTEANQQAVNTEANTEANSQANNPAKLDSPGKKTHPWRVAVAAAVATAAITVPIVSRLSGSSFSLAAVAKQVAAQESSRTFTLKSEKGNELAQVVVGKDGQGYLTSDSLPKLDAKKAYQLWAVTTSGPVSLGILGADPSVQAFATPQTYAALAISVEDAAGAAAPTPPIASAVV
jgi:Anti-sigma-K factor rskA